MKKLGLLLCLLLLIIGLTSCSTNKDISSAPSTPTSKERPPSISPIPSSNEKPITSSGLDFNIDSYKGTDDYAYVQIVFKNLTATVNMDHAAFAQTFLPDIDPKTYEYVMKQVERYKKIYLIEKKTDQITVVVSYDRPSTNEFTNRSYVLRKNVSGEWLLYTIDQSEERLAFQIESCVVTCNYTLSVWDGKLVELLIKEKG